MSVHPLFYQYLGVLQISFHRLVGRHLFNNVDKRNFETSRNSCLEVVVVHRPSP